MNDKFIVCDNCGAKCDINDTYCKSCSRTLSLSDYSDDQIIDGIENSELKSYIGKNSDYYIQKFAKKKDKLFIQLNFAALLFGPTWFFYRKMYKTAMIYVAVLILLSSLLSLVLPAVFKADVERYYVAKETYSNYINSGEETHIFKDPPYSYVMIGRHPTFQKIYDNLDEAQNKIRLIDFLISAPVLIINILFRLFANPLYKKHVIANVHTADGGTSGKAAFAGFLAVNVVMFVISLLILQIPIVSSFQDATQMLFNWM